ncbi:MAG: Spx/MgsR family RNA polymerase-binding regulatory protein [Methylacidiphilales bacterium]|nr:Spx/MgsR family RNA polymerase-binding regulatory protein [Candidatus Methylacidiphilales bacterium]NJR15142.1 Spx/MgsR family RNA polymerase-binding regulatory protein [Calothrix sp. CSU_2_0]
MSLEVYGIPNCGTCKKALQWLQRNSIEHVFINIKENPPSPEMIQSWVKILGFQVMRNTSGQSYRALGEDKKSWNDQQWIEAFAKDGMLLKRPLLVKDGTAVMAGFKEAEIRDKL